MFAKGQHESLMDPQIDLQLKNSKRTNVSGGMAVFDLFVQKERKAGV